MRRDLEVRANLALAKLIELGAVEITRGSNAETLYRIKKSFLDQVALNTAIIVTYRKLRGRKIHGEREIYEAITAELKRRDPSLTPKELEDMLGVLRAWIPYEKLAEALKRKLKQLAAQSTR